MARHRLVVHLCGGLVFAMATACNAQSASRAAPAADSAAATDQGTLVRERLATPPVSAAVLDSMRGGFDDGNGLRASFGIERSTSVNGAVVALQSVQIADLSRISAEQAGRLAAILGTGTLVQNGAANSLAAGQAQLRAGTVVIQNSLDNQQIRSSTVIDSASNSLRLLQGINAAGSLRDALLAPLAARP